PGPDAVTRAGPGPVLGDRRRGPRDPDPDPVHAAVVDQRHGVAGDLTAVELHDAVVRLVRGRHLDLVDARAVAVTQREAGPRAGQARRDDQRVAAAPEAEDA